VRPARLVSGAPAAQLPGLPVLGIHLRIAVVLPGLLRLHPPLPRRRMRGLPPDHRGEERALPAVLAAGRDHRRRAAPARPGGLPARWLPAAVVRRDEPARQHRPAARRPRTRVSPARRPAGQTQLELPAPGESRHFDKAHWVASAITGPALLQTRHIAAGLAGTRGWNPRIITETGRALAVILASHQAGDMIAWSALPPALRPGTSASPGPPRSSRSPGCCTTTGSPPSRP